MAYNLAFNYPVTPTGWINSQIIQKLINDSGLQTALGANGIRVYWNQGPNDAEFPYISFNSKFHGEVTLNYMADGRVYFSVYDRASDSERLEYICQRIKCIFAMSGLPSNDGVVNCITLYENEMFDEFPTGDPAIKRMELSFPARYYDIQASNEKIARSFPNSND